MNFYRELNAIMTCDMGGRGLRLPAPDLPAVARELLAARGVLILTGFPVLAADGTVRGETDGPIGAAEIACALARLGIPTTVAAEELHLPLLRAAVAAFAGEDVPIRGAAVPAAGVVPASYLAAGTPVEVRQISAAAPVDTAAFSHLIAIERPGKAADGHFHSMKGRILDADIIDTDPVFDRFPGVKIAVGDGGNELGMGKFIAEIAETVEFGAQIAAKSAADHVLCAGVSNWWGMGLAALLSCAAGRDLLAAPETESLALRAVVSAGAVDGCAGKSDLSVDGLPSAVHLERRALVRALLDGHLPQNGMAHHKISDPVAPARTL